MFLACPAFVPARLFTKAVPLAEVPLKDLLALRMRRSVQLPGVIFLTSPGHAWHTTMSAGWSLADSTNFMTNICGKVREGPAAHHRW